MVYEVTSKRTIQDAKGNDKEIAEKYLFENLEFLQKRSRKCTSFLTTKM